MTATQRPGIRKLPEGTDPIRLELADHAETLGKTMAAVERVERAIASLRTEHETYTRTIIQTQILVEELLEKQSLQARILARSQKLVPMAVALIEIARQVLTYTGVLK